MATGTSFPDALAATPAAVAAGAPILLTRPDVVPEATTTELVRLAPSRIVLIGGAGAVSAAVEAQLTAVAPVTRVSGADRYATATEVSRRSFASGASTVFLATGLTHPDALVGAAYAARLGAPVLLTRGECLPPAVVNELARLQPTRVMLLGRSASLDGDVSGPTC